ncbi:MAG: relaxase/mobilization nuclease domain-containing protein [Bacteroides sp.]|nr:relaxase/mobilization nuclease domain-containing protein [Bacteroides sp.]
MIAYIINGKSFGNCVDYVTRRALEEQLNKEQSHHHKTAERKYEPAKRLAGEHEAHIGTAGARWQSHHDSPQPNNGEDIIEHLSKDWHLLCATSDIRIYEGRKAMAEDIARPTKTRKPIKDPVGHISLDFHPKDKPRMTDEVMAEIAQDYMKQMGLTNTPFVVVRHYDKEHPHCHIIFSRVDYDGKILTQTTNFKKNERVCKALNRKYQLMQGKSKLNTDVSKLRGKEKVRYQLVQDIAKLFIHPSVKDWNSYLDILRQHGITVKEKVGKSGRMNLYYCVGKHEFWYRKLNPYLSRENLEKVFRARSGKQKGTSQVVKKTVSQKPVMTTLSDAPKPKPQSKSVVIPPLPDGFMGARIAPHDLDRYQKGEAVCAYICKPDEIVGKHHWIWYDFKTGQPQCETTPPPADRYIPEDFERQMTASKGTSDNLTQGAGITLSYPAIGSAHIQDEGFTNGAAIPDDFKLWLS